MARLPATRRLDTSPLHMLHRAGQRAAELFQKELGANDLTPRQYAVLVTVSNDEGLNQTQLVERTGIDRSTMADLIRRMLRKGILQRRRTREDARAYAVKLTALGTQTLEAVEPVSRRVDAQILAFLPTDQRHRLLQDLNGMVNALGNSEPKETARKRKLKTAATAR
jgi:MarR family transcriptional regulator, temperature-dependent positive regulator of motility